MKETIDLEREFQTLLNENQLLKQKLYTNTLDYKSVNFKIQEMKESLDENEETRRRQQSYFIEKFADLIFRVHNLGVSDIKKEIRVLTTLIYDNRILLEQLTEVEVRDWIMKVYL